MKLFLLVSILLFPLLAPGQEGSESPSPEIVEEVSDTNEILENRDQRVDEIEKISKPEEAPAGPLAQYGYNGPITGFNIMKTEALVALEKFFMDAKLHETPRAEIEKMILTTFERSPVRHLLRASPQFLNLCVNFFADEEALISGVRILKDKDRLKDYLYYWIGIMFAAYYFKRVFISKFWSKRAQTFAKICFSLMLTVITLSTFCIIFKPEMTPILRVIKSSF